MQSMSASPAFWGAFSHADMHTGATSGVAPTEAIRQAAASTESSPGASQCSTPTKQSPRRRLSGLFSKLALLSVVMLAAMPSAAACSHGNAERKTLNRHSGARRLQQAASSTASGPAPFTVDYQTAAQLAAANGVAGQPQGRRALSAPRTCAYDDDAEASPEAEAELQPRIQHLNGPGAGRALMTNINLYFHVICKDTFEGCDYVSPDMINNQVVKLNQAFNPSNFNFQLATTDYTNKSAWYPLDIFSGENANMKELLRRGTAADLNVYITNLNNGGIIGVASNPWGYGVGYLPYDGAIIETGTMPGAWYGGYNVGMNLVHEAGHWMGLAHVFSGGCSEGNDGCDDTAQMSGPNYNCYINPGDRPNSCPNRPANQPTFDPVNNYMGYTYDNCMWEFTGNQTTRMTAAWQAYRASSYQQYTAPTPAPTAAPTKAPTKAPTAAPTKAPTAAPTKAPTAAPTLQPTAPPRAPTAESQEQSTGALDEVTQPPSAGPTAAPTKAPTASPSKAPTRAPTPRPTKRPTPRPTPKPTRRRFFYRAKPTPKPTKKKATSRRKLPKACGSKCGKPQPKRLVRPTLKRPTPKRG